jgi:formiminotetrahydrofolate cyclodeaminase
MMSLVDTPVRHVLAAFSSPDPTPGGGSASALASAVGASLLMMVAALPKTRSGSDEDRSALARAATAAGEAQRELMEAIDADAAAYDRVVSAYRLPKTTGEEKAARTVAVQRALRDATDVPLRVMRMSARGLDAAALVAAHGHRAAASDVGVAVALLRSGLHGARLNVDINLGGIKDEPYTREVAADVERLAQQALSAATLAEQSLAAPA